MTIEYQKHILFLCIRPHMTLAYCLLLAYFTLSQNDTRYIQIIITVLSRLDPYEGEEITQVISAGIADFKLFQRFYMMYQLHNPNGIGTGRGNGSDKRSSQTTSATS